MMSNILLVEDNPDLAYGLRNNLEIEGYDVTVAGDGEIGLQRALELDPSLVILDLMLPKLDGYRVLRALREAGSQVPVLILTAKGEEADKVLGFRMGADDYVTKPFGVLELLARVRAVLRRTRNGNGMAYPADGDRFGDVEVDTRARTVLKADATVPLTPKEFDLLVALLRRHGAVASRLELMKEVWGHRAAVVSRTVDTHVAELRRKLEEDPSNPRHILTVWKAGYRLER
ncbi:MAG: response regulator transcription factor [Gemmatimonadota bacterium]